MNTIIIENHGKNDSEFESIKWALKARSTDKTRPAINCIKIDGGLLIATDGERLHLTMTERELSDGVYEVKSCTGKTIVLQSTEEFIYPAYERVFPRVKMEYAGVLNGKAWPLLHRVYKYIANDKISFNEQFLLDACMSNSKFYIGEHDGEIKPLILYNGNDRAALIMPIKNQ